mmetsp:Transcript_14865/g.21107  ORF Transcript_14865/g.21107 Transcript_14865/m.21107 type:complete len:110 (-) Transcript_14865:1359-1688(-)
MSSSPSSLGADSILPPPRGNFTSTISCNSWGLNCCCRYAVGDDVSNEAIVCNAELRMTSGNLYTFAMASGIVAVREWDEEVAIDVLTCSSLVLFVFVVVELDPLCATVT